MKSSALRAVLLHCAGLLPCAVLFAACAAQPPATPAAAAPAASVANAAAPANADMAQKNAQTRALADAYARSLENDKTLAPLWIKTSLIPNEATPAQLARSDRVSAADKPLLRALSQRALSYRAEMGALLRSHGVDALLLSLWEGGAEAADVLRAQLHNGALTWGEYNTRLREITTAQRMALAEAGDALHAGDVARARQAQGHAQEAYVRALAEPARVAGRGAVHGCEAIGKAMYCQ